MTLGNMQVGHQTLPGEQTWTRLNGQIPDMTLNSPEASKQQVAILTQDQRQISDEMMEQLMRGRLTPGEIYDLALQDQIHELNKKYGGVNFGLEFTNETFDFFLPRRLDKEKNKVLYR
jgi:hypothetical protein